MAEQERIGNSNLACLGAGVNTIQSFQQGSAESIFCKEWYELIVEAELSLYSWRFATEMADITDLRLTDDALPEGGRWNNAYEQPPGLVDIDTVLVNDKPIEYERMGTRILTKDTMNDSLVVQYRFRADETTWTPYFKLLIVYRLATMLSFSIARKDDIAASMKGLADEHWRKSKTQDAQGQTNKKVNLSKLTRARGGKVTKFWRDR